MFWTILLIAAPIITFTVMFVRMKMGHRDGYGTPFDIADAYISALITGFAVACFGLIGSLFISEHSEEYTVTESHELKALQDGSSVSGSFFLGIGSFGEDMKYHYYVERDGAFYLDSIDADAVGIVYTNASPTYVETFKRNKPTFWSWFRGVDTVPKREFHVPSGSIKQDYTLDAQ